MLAQFRPIYQRIMAPIGFLSIRLGLTPNFWTLFSVFMSMVAAYILAQGAWGWGLLASFLVMLIDAFDGATARAGGTASKFGMVLDHNMDRYAEFFLMLGILLSGELPAWLILTTLFGMVMASYVRAKAESAGLKDGVVGWAGRAEKMTLLWVGLGLEGLGLHGALFWAIALIGAISHITFIQRLLYSNNELTLGSSV